MFDDLAMQLWKGLGVFGVLAGGYSCFAGNAVLGWLVIIAGLQAIQISLLIHLGYDPPARGDD